MAVFDGMGGESCGEMAAFLAAESCGMHYKEQKERVRREGDRFLIEACEKMNQAVMVQKIGLTAWERLQRCSHLVMILFTDVILETAGYIEVAPGNSVRFPRITYWADIFWEKLH